MFASPLERAIARGMKPGGDLAEELSDLDDYNVRSRNDARAICKALRALPSPPSDKRAITSPLFALTGLFQNVEGPEAPAFDVLYREGLPELIRIYKSKAEHPDDDETSDLLFVLKILAMYGSREGAETIVAAARKPLKPGDYLWHAILANFSTGHPHRDYVFEALSDPLPPDFLAVALVDSANAAARDHGLKRHPFHSPAGHQRLQSWLEDRKPDHFSYAHSATAALPFIGNPPRDQLLALAMDHVDAGVQMEAAWAAGKLGREAGLKILARYCLDVAHSDEARQYLTELGRDDIIPAAADDADFRAKADFARWLSHPSELGQPPDELEIVDHRRLAWPPEREAKPFWLIRYRLRDRSGLEDDDVDCGLVGSMTWCFFSYKMHQRPPEDAYAIHCYWEMQHADLIDQADEEDATRHAAMLAQWQGAALQEARITHVATISPELKYPTKRVAIATAKIDGQDGWAVLDGPGSAWFPKAEQPEGTFDSVPLMIHVGRQLLGLTDKPDRKKYLVADAPRRMPEQIIVAYEKLLDEAMHGEPERQADLLGGYGLLSQHFDHYIEALAAAKGADKTDIMMGAYERLCQIAEQTDSSVHEEVYASTSMLGDEFDQYVDALVSRGRSAEIAALITSFAPHWQNNLGYNQLGGAALKAGDRALAERYLVKLLDDRENYYRQKKIGALAEIWHSRGEVDRARDLLLDCMRRQLAEIEQAKYASDRKTFSDELQQLRTLYLRLFPGRENELVKAIGDVP